MFWSLKGADHDFLRSFFTGNFKKGFISKEEFEQHREEVEKV
ncbi:hypothetical protein [Metabacillus endolithicus]